MESRERRTWAEIDLGALEHNYRTIRAALPEGCRFLGVVKANAYGHGAIPVARRLEKLGADYLAVACLDEAAELRVAGITLPILILGHTPAEFAGDLVRMRLTQAVWDVDTARAISDAAQAEGRTAKIHLQIDTGMSRLGLLCDEAHRAESVETIAAICALPGLEHEGIFTHFSDADGSEEYSMLQLTRFLDLIRDLEEKGLRFSLRHCAASAATLRFPCAHMDMVRPGLELYGHYPAPELEGLDGPGLEPVMTLKTRVAAVRDLPAGAYVSYGRTAQLKEDTKLAVLGIGYADGLARALSNRGTILIGGKERPITGRVCMDLCMVRVDGDVHPGDVAEVFGRELPIEKMADELGTISYEIMCNIARRVPRIYLEGARTD
ncbi:alanine racemase [Pseudoflavonifractor sp. MSJ-37]|uniref:alanine racemase n=1 Tax=Pseudoflavonifractor sp. MSJ-37 TaxID=2841531 RepID=UPI001C0F87D7|nr:alanine racemase [Pseudoflavonifractor sp. MSJ-37]MBU5434704.1 alanine racemase [Pseudoflavonifractor sp. MSJ-37]